MLNNMSRGRLVWYLFLVTLASGLTMSVTGSVEAQSTRTFILSGMVTDNDGGTLEGYTVEAPLDTSDLATVTKTDAAGEYKIVYNAIFASAVIAAGDTIQITVKDPSEQVVASESYTVTVADINREPLSGAVVNIQLSGLTVDLDPSQLPADGVSTTAITVSVYSGGAPVTDDTLTITAGQGSISGQAGYNNGTYTADYTAPALVLTESIMDTITVSSGTTGDTTTVTVTLQVVPTVITVSVNPSVFIAGGAATGAVQITAMRGTNAVADANISLGLRRADGGSDTGTVTGVTSDGTGAYSATYTPPSAAGQINITATDAVSGANGTATVTVNAGAAATITVSAAPMTVSSGGSAVITAMVMDGSGNGVGGLTLEGAAGSGSVGEFSGTAPFGSYRATYSAGTVESDGTDTVTVSVGGLAGEVTINLTPAPPKEVSILVVRGTVYKKDGTGPVSNVNVGVSVGGMPAQTTGTGSDGTYSVTIVNPGGVAGRTGDSVSVVVTDSEGMERGRDDSVLTNEELGDESSAVVVRNVNTDILARTSALVVTGSVFRVDSEVPINDVFEITVMNTTRNLEVSGTTDGSGTYSLTFFGTGVVAETGEALVVTASRDGAAWSSPAHMLSSEEVENGRAIVNVPTDIKASTSALAVSGTVYFDDGGIAVGAGVTVTSVNAGRELESSGMTDGNGNYSVTFFSADGLVAESGDMIVVSAVHDDGEVGSTEHELTTAEVDAQRAEVDVTTSLKAWTSTLAVTGTVFYVESDIPVGGGFAVTVMNAASGTEASGVTGANGMYNVTFFSTEGRVAETDDVLTVTVDGGEDGSGSAEHTLAATEIDAQRAVVDVPTNIKATSPTFLVSGTVYLEDGVSGAPAGLTVKVMNETRGINAQGRTTIGGGYVVTFLEIEAAAVKTADVLALDVVVMADDEMPIGETSVTLTSADVVAQRRDNVDITTSLTADPTNAFVVDGTVRNPSGNIVGLGVKVRVSLGDRAPTVLETNASGRFSATYFDSAGVVASVYDTVEIQAVNSSTGASAYESMQLASEHIIAQRLTINVMLVPDSESPVAVAEVSQRFLDLNEITKFDASKSTDSPLDSQLIATYAWDFGDGTSGSGVETTHSYSKPGRYDVTLTVTDLAGNAGTAHREIFVSTVRLGGISLNTRHTRDVLDGIISLAIAETDLARQMSPEQLLEMMRANPAIQAAVAKVIGDALPPGLIPKQLLAEELPLIFEQYENIDLENFGNAITARSDANGGILGSVNAGAGRVVNGDKLDLYLVTPRADIGSVTFRFDGDTLDATEAIDSLPHTFQLEEEQAIMNLPSWPGIRGDMGQEAFSAVTLMLASEELPSTYENLISRSAWSYRETGDYQSASLSPRDINGKVVWEAQVDIQPGKIYYYYYDVELAYPVPLYLGEGMEHGELTRYALPDPRNLQLQDRGLVEALFTQELQETIAPLLNPIVSAIVAGTRPFND